MTIGDRLSAAAWRSTGLSCYRRAGRSACDARSPAVAPATCEPARSPAARRSPARSAARALALAATLVLAGCAGAPVPDWQSNARLALDRGAAAYLRGEAAVAQAEFALARSELARTGRADLVARAELTRCAVQVASLVLDACAGFEALRAQAGAAERAYADYLAGRIAPAEVALLPAQHRAVATVAAGEAEAALRRIDDPLARLVAAGVLMRSARASPQAIALAADTASAQGWRRPLLAWLGVQRELATRAGDAATDEALHLRMRLVAGEK
jgi:hypothetical protein